MKSFQKEFFGGRIRFGKIAKILLNDVVILLLCCVHLTIKFDFLIVGLNKNDDVSSKVNHFDITHTACTDGHNMSLFMLCLLFSVMS